MFKPITAEVIATWPVPNYTDPVKRGRELYIITALAGGIATICLLARLYSRIFIRRYFGPDDGLICFAYIAALGVTTCSILGNLRYGWDRHIWDVLPTKIEAGTKNLYVVRMFWGFATSSVRLSICCLYYRLLNRVSGPTSYRMVLHLYTAFTIGLAIVYLFTTVLPCAPIRAYWELADLPGQKCDDDALIMEVAAVINTLSEFGIACLPIIATFKLHIDPNQRWTVIGLLSLNFFVAFAGCFRTYYVWRSMSEPQLDMTWWAEPHFISSEVEIYLAITCACAAPLRPLVAYLYRRIRGLPPRLPTMLPKRPSFSTYTSKPSLDRSNRSGADTPTPHYFDLDGLGIHDGYGYTVTISGPPPKPKTSTRLRRRRKPSLVSESLDPVYAKPENTHRSSSMSRSVGLDIETTREVEVREEIAVPRSSTDYEQRWNTKLNEADFRELEIMSIRGEKSWYRE